MMNDTESDSIFNNDLPITELADDRLERAKIAGKLADDIQGYFNSTDDKPKKRREESFVIAILGKWGEGKTSFINLVSKKLKDKNNKNEYDSPRGCKCKAVTDIEVLRWDPWYFSTKTDLGQQLYELIRPQCKLLAWERFIFFILLPFLVASCCFWILKYLDLVDHPTIFLTIFGIASVVLSELYKKYPKNKFVPKYPFFSAAIIKKMFFLFKDPINSFIEQYQYNFDETKSSLKEITKDRKLLIVIDDVDRMEPNQVKQIFDLVNGTGNLPNTVYLIAFDKIVVSKAINTTDPTEGERYLAKLIHHSIPLWYDYQGLITSELKKEFKRSFDFDYHLFLKLITNIRDLKTLVNETKVKIKRINYSINNENINYGEPDSELNCELDISDLLSINLIKQKNYAVYKLISDNKEILCEESDSFSQELKRFDEDLDQLKNSYLIKEIVTKLFPNYQDRLTEKDKLSNIITQLHPHEPLKICHSDYFDIFFNDSFPSYLVNHTQYRILLNQQNHHLEIHPTISEFIKDLSRKDKYRWLGNFGQRLKLLNNKWIREKVNFNIENTTYYVVAITKIAGHLLLEYDNQTIDSSDRDIYSLWINLQQVFCNLLNSNISTDGVPPINVNIILDSIKEEQGLSSLPITYMFLTLKHQLIVSHLNPLLPALINNVLQRFEELPNFYFERIISLCTMVIMQEDGKQFTPPDNFAILIDRIKNELKSNDDLFLRFIKCYLQGKDLEDEYTNISRYAEHYIDLPESLKRLTDMQDNPKYSDDDNKKLIDISIKAINNYLENTKKEPL